MRWLVFWLAVCLTFWLALGYTVTHATDYLFASTWSGAWNSPQKYTTATCRAAGIHAGYPQSVWIAQTGTALLDIIQVGTVNGRYFYAYGRGVPNGPGSLYVEKDFGSAGTGPHTYRIQLESAIDYNRLNITGAVWLLTIDGIPVARISDSFRTWKIRHTQIMTEGDLPIGAASCRFPGTGWNFGGYGPQPPFHFTNNWWSVTK
jgi:hypothetical protein